jgi:N-acetylmuramoyl-L-alanine amidase
MTTMPSVLIETGFITNSSEEKFLNSKEGQDYIASAIFRACRDYIAEIDSKSGISWGNEQISSPEANPATNRISKTEEIIFKVQITASATKKEIRPENFNGITDITELSGDNRFKYASGSFTDYSEAVNHRKKLESIYPGAFVIAVKENKIVPLQQALDQIKNK